MTPSDAQHLRATIALAHEGGDDVYPDPWVGAIVAAADDPARVVGHGHHGRYGSEHAEPGALRAAGRAARGGTLYCNLEPCSYEAPQKRHPPCTRAIIEAGVARVVVGQIDPHPRVRGGGVRRLREAGVRVDLAPDPLPFWLANPVFTTEMALGRPLVQAVTTAVAAAATGPARPPWDIDLGTADLDGPLPAGRSVRLLVDEPAQLELAAGWPIDLVDGRPTDAWMGALHAVLDPVATRPH